MHVKREYVSIYNIEFVTEQVLVLVTLAAMVLAEDNLIEPATVDASSADTVAFAPAVEGEGEQVQERGIFPGGLGGLGNSFGAYNSHRYGGYGGYGGGYGGYGDFGGFGFGYNRPPLIY